MLRRTTYQAAVPFKDIHTKMSDIFICVMHGKMLTQKVDYH